MFTNMDYREFVLLQEQIQLSYGRLKRLRQYWIRWNAVCGESRMHGVERGKRRSSQRQAKIRLRTKSYLSLLNMWARKNARPFILRKIEPDEDPIALADELLETLYVPALCL